MLSPAPGLRTRASMCRTVYPGSSVSGSAPASSSCAASSKWPLVTATRSGLEPGRIDRPPPRIPGENYIESLAHRWRVCQQIHATYADEMILIRYEDFVADKLGSLRELAAKLSSPEVQDVVALLDVPFQPRGDRSTNWNDFFGETNLRKIESICKDGMAAMGYAPSL